jgi:Ca2+-binding EF-hand superfamily protein
LTAEETVLLEIYENMSAPPITERRTKIFDAFDTNKDGKVDF